MSEQQNIALIQRIYDAFGRGDVPAILDNLTSDVAWDMEGPSSIPLSGHRKGPAGAKEFFAALGGTQQNQKLTIDEWVAQGDKVATFGTYKATVTATGKTTEGKVAHLFTVKDGKVTRWLGLSDTAAMVDAYTGGASAAGR